MRLPSGSRSVETHRFHADTLHKETRFLSSDTASGKVLLSDDARTTGRNWSSGLPGTAVNPVLGQDGRLRAETGGSGIWSQAGEGLSWTNTSTGLLSLNVGAHNTVAGVLCRAMS